MQIERVRSYSCLPTQLQTDSILASGLCCQIKEWQKCIYPMYQDPRFGSYIYEIPSDRRNGGTLKGIHRLIFSRKFVVTLSVRFTACNTGIFTQISHAQLIFYFLILNLIWWLSCSAKKRHFRDKLIYLKHGSIPGIPSAEHSRDTDYCQYSLLEFDVRIRFARISIPRICPKLSWSDKTIMMFQLPINESDSKLYATNSSSLIFISSGDNICVFNTNPMEMLPTLQLRYPLCL